MRGIVLLDQNDYYVDCDGNLPPRPEGDKDYLLQAVKNKICVASSATYEKLPKSLFASADIVFVNTIDEEKASHNNQMYINLGIATYSIYGTDTSEIKVIRTESTIKQGKKFRYRDDYKHVGTYEHHGLKIETWKRM